jgi:hypothetical protein
VLAKGLAIRQFNQILLNFDSASFSTKISTQIGHSPLSSSRFTTPTGAQSVGDMDKAVVLAKRKIDKEYLFDSGVDFWEVIVEVRKAGCYVGERAEVTYLAEVTDLDLGLGLERGGQSCVAVSDFLPVV